MSAFRLLLLWPKLIKEGTIFVFPFGRYSRNTIRVEQKAVVN